MKSKIKNIKTVTLVLNEEEAIWLKNITQNPLYDGPLGTESEENSKMRKLFWDALDNFDAI